MYFLRVSQQISRWRYMLHTQKCLRSAAGWPRHLAVASNCQNSLQSTTSTRDILQIHYVYHIILNCMHGHVLFML